MKAQKSEEQGGSTREAILDATEAIMVEEGYAAVTSRRVEERAGLRSQLVHYHFGTMDDLLVAVYERVQREFLRRHLRAVSSESPLRALWEFSLHPQRTRLAQELIALSNHRKSIRKLTAGILEQMHSINETFIAKYLEEAGVDTGKYPPIAISYIINGLSRALVTEETLGAATRRPQILPFVERLLSEVEAKHRAYHAKRAGRARAPADANRDGGAALSEDAG